MKDHILVSFIISTAFMRVSNYYIPPDTSTMYNLSYEFHDDFIYGMFAN